MKKSTGTITVTLKVRGEPAAVVRALANGLPLEALEEIRDGMKAEVEKRLARPRKGTRRITIKGKRRS